MTTGFFRRHWLDVVGIGLLAAVVAWGLWGFFAPFAQQPAARRELVAFTAELRLGLSREHVQRHLRTARRVHLSSTDVGADEVLIETPYTFGAGSWLAWLAFTDGRLSSVCVRTHDGKHVKPAGSPPDIGTPPRPAR
jgi:hypothetical protein